MVEPTALLLWNGNWLRRARRRFRIKRALRYLVLEEKVLASSAGKLAPRDGQLEAKGTRLRAERYLKLPYDLLRIGIGHLFIISIHIVFQVAKRSQMPKPLTEDLAQTKTLMSRLFEYVDRSAVTEQILRDAIAHNPNDAAAYYNLGVLLDDLNRPAEAEQAYRDAIARDPNYAKAYTNLGVLLHEKLNRPVEAEQAYRDAIARDPNYAAAYSNLGLLLHEKLNRPTEAEQAYRTGLTISPNDTDILNNLVLLLRLQGRESDALPLLDKWAPLEPQNFNPPLALASIHKQLGNTSAPAQAAEVRALIPADDWYNLACLESICGNVDAALAHLRRAAAQPNFDRTWAWRDPDLQWVRGAPRFAEIVGKEEPPSHLP